MDDGKPNNTINERMDQLAEQLIHPLRSEEEVTLIERKIKILKELTT